MYGSLYVRTEWGDALGRGGEAGWRDVLAALVLFLGFPGTAIACWGIRAYREFRRTRNLDRLEAESLRDEGYPPGPPHPPPSSLPEE